MCRYVGIWLYLDIWFRKAVGQQAVRQSAYIYSEGNVTSQKSSQAVKGEEIIAVTEQVEYMVTNPSSQVR